MKNIIVIADDITGAAEIAGIAFKHGLQVRLLCCSATSVANSVGSATSAAEVTVLATDTRGMTEQEAVAETHHLTKQITSLFTPPLGGGGAGVVLFKKTDSALRGHVVAELEAIIADTPYERALYIPANPSKGRTIRNGIYYVGDRPISDTDFSFDPEFPATTSSMADRFAHGEEKGICWCDATSMEDIRRAVAATDLSTTLLAGAADLFTAFLSSISSPRPSETGKGEGTKLSSLLFVCGSTQSKPLDLGIPICQMPLEVYEQQADAEAWAAALTEEQNRQPSHSLMLTIPHHHRTGKEIAVYLRTVMGKVVQRLVENHPPKELIIEGGATAWQILQQLGWKNFNITDEIAPGVVRMHAIGTDTYVTMKPGSYPWGDLNKILSLDKAKKN